MAFVGLTNGKRFNPQTAKPFEEGKRWDGRNRISLATGTQWDHEALFHSARGTWIVKRWSDWQPGKATWEEVGSQFVATWMVKNGYEDEAIPEELRDEVEALDVDRQPDGRTERIQIRATLQEVEMLRAAAASASVSVSEWMRKAALEAAKHRPSATGTMVTAVESRNTYRTRNEDIDL